jgi:hypothetical protein
MSLSSEELNNVKNFLRVRETVKKSENPHPFVMLSIVIVVIMVMYCIYVNVIKPHIGGKWIDDDDVSRTIVHNKWTDVVYADSKYRGVFKGNLLLMQIDDKMHMGIYINNQIRWMNGDIWYSVKKSRWVL